MSPTRSRYPSPKVPQCPDCKVDMEPGLIPDNWNAIYTDQSSWVQGKPEDRMLTGLKLSGRPVFPITAFRCSKCGLLRSYAFKPSQRHG